MQNLDNSWTVEFKVEGELAVRLGVEGNGTLRYDFATEAEAEEFRDEFYAIFTDGWKSMDWSLDGARAAVSNLDKAKDVIPDVLKHLADPDHLVSMRGEFGVIAHDLQQRVRSISRGGGWSRGMAGSCVGGSRVLHQG